MKSILGISAFYHDSAAAIIIDGEIIGEGFHEKYGNPHAEIMAYKNSIKDPTDSTMYITLDCKRTKYPKSF